jgi:D-arabinose 1-dehydrogenase-like Zn-dependent alcohol dehydrogenase
MGTRAEFKALLGMVGAAGIRPLVDTVYPLEEAPLAFQRLASGEVAGKLVVRVS